jgi:hypothetical protein
MSLKQILIKDSSDPLLDPSSDPSSDSNTSSSSTGLSTIIKNISNDIKTNNQYFDPKSWTMEYFHKGFKILSDKDDDVIFSNNLTKVYLNCSYCLIPSYITRPDYNKAVDILCEFLREKYGCTIDSVTKNWFSYDEVIISVDFSKMIQSMVHYDIFERCSNWKPFESPLETYIESLIKTALNNGENTISIYYQNDQCIANKTIYKDSFHKMSRYLGQDINNVLIKKGLNAEIIDYVDASGIYSHRWGPSIKIVVDVSKVLKEIRKDAGIPESWPWSWF